MALTGPIPIILLGRSVDVGRLVARHLLPELEVTHFFTSESQAKTDIPVLAIGRAPHTASEVGSGDHTKIPKAVVLGLGYTKEVFDDIHAGVTASTRESQLYWFWGGMDRAAFQAYAQKAPIPEPATYAPEVAKTTKAKVLEVLSANVGRGATERIHIWHSS